MAGVGTVLRAVRLFWQRGDQILPLLEVLPDTLTHISHINSARCVVISSIDT